MKVCSKCKTEKDRSEFQNDRTRHDGLFPYCKECKKQSKKIDYLKHKEKRLSSNKSYVKNNAGRVKEYKSKWATANKHKILKRAKELRKLDPESFKKRQKRYRTTRRLKKTASYNHAKSRNRRYAEKRREILCDAYLRKCLKDQGVPKELISVELIEMKRQIIKIIRYVKDKEKNAANH